MSDLQTTVNAAENVQDSQFIYDTYRAHNSGLRIHTDTTIQAALLSQYPSCHLIVTPFDLIKYAHAGYAIATLNEDVHPSLRTWTFEPVAQLYSNGTSTGKLVQAILFGRYDYVWQDHQFQVFVVDGQNTLTGQCDRRCYVLSKSTTKGGNDETTLEVLEALILAAGTWSEQCHEQVWVYDQGRWSKDEALWRMVQGASWNDVILQDKRAIMRDTLGFFDARETYAEFGTPWKRGLIFHGSPGNGKTTTAKALMKALMDRPKPILTLVVKTLAQLYFGPQMSVRQIFTKARQVAPCLLLFEDVDSLVTDQVRSYFFNEVDGLEQNDGILMIASTNHLDKLDPGLSKRPSRFDRKYGFDNPSFDDRVRYCEYWGSKLSSTPAAITTSIVPHHIASMTDGFSFAYLKEAYINSLLTLLHDATNEDVPAGVDAPAPAEEEEEEEDRKLGRFGRILQKQVAVLREDIAR